jgi:hypothetical protein
MKQFLTNLKLFINPNKLLTGCFKELFLAFLTFLSLVHLIGLAENSIHSDGAGYFDYLPSLFEREDLIRKDFPLRENAVLYSSIINNKSYVKIDSFLVNKYPCGVALAQAPFYFFSRLMFSTLSQTDFLNGSLDSYFVIISAFFYLIIALVYLRLLLQLFNIKALVITYLQVILVLATPVLHYVNMDASYSHIYSLFAVTLFLYFVRNYFLFRLPHYFYLSMVFLGLIFLIRPFNIVILLLVPAMANSPESMKLAFGSLFSNLRMLFLGCLIVLTIFSIQFVLWYLQTGYWILDSYPGEKFNFSNPQIVEYLFGYQKGLFVYTPILFIMLMSIIVQLFKSQYYMLWYMVSFLILISYIQSCWWSWSYGSSFGMRPFIEFYPVLFISFGLIFSNLKSLEKSLFVFITLFTTPLNIIQAYQYKNYILNWDGMTKKTYWEVFLRTDQKFSGLAWKQNADLSDYVKQYDLFCHDILSIKQLTGEKIFVSDSISSMNQQVDLVRISFINNFDIENETEIIISINKDGKNLFWRSIPIIQFRQESLNSTHTGFYDVKIPHLDDFGEYEVDIEALAKNSSDILRNIEIELFSLK